MRTFMIFGLLTSTIVLADDWSSVRNGPAQRGVAESALTGDLSIRWEKDAPDGIVASAAIYDGRVYVGTLGGMFWCLDVVDGSEVWTTSSTADDTGFRPGFTAPPTVTETAVFVGDEDGTFYCIDQKTGDVVWTKTTNDQIVGGATVVTVDDENRVLFGSHDGTLYCVRASDGEEVWAFQTDGPVNCSVALASDDGTRRTFVAGCDELLRVIDVNSGEQVASMPLGSPLIASPAIAGKMLYVGSYAGVFNAIDWTKLESSWSASEERTGQPIHSSAVVTDTHVIVGGRDRNLRCYERSSGKPVWVVKTRSKIDSSPVVSGDRVYVGTGDKRILGVGVTSGEIEWEYAAGRPVTVGPAIADGCLVIGTEGPRGKFLCFE